MEFVGGRGVKVYETPLLDDDGGEGEEAELFEGGTKDQVEGVSLYRLRRDAGPPIVPHDDHAVLYLQQSVQRIQ